WVAVCQPTPAAGTFQNHTCRAGTTRLSVSASCAANAAHARSRIAAGCTTRPMSPERPSRSSTAREDRMLQTSKTPRRILGLYDEPFWRYMKEEGEMRLQCCSECGAFRYPPAPVCAECL